MMESRTEYRKELSSYLVGMVLAVILTGIAFASVAWSGLSRTAILWIVALSAIIQVAVHLRFFLHIDLSKSKRDDLELILFSVLIVVLMVGGTIWIMGNLHMRMM